MKKNNVNTTRTPKGMSRKATRRKVKSPRGAMMGESIIQEGRMCLMIKSAKTYDVITPEEAVEAITGVPVKEIIYDEPLVLNR